MDTSEQKKKIYYIFNGRFPSEKAHALYVVKHCEAFVDLGYPVTVVVPDRFRSTDVPYSDYFNVPKTFDVVYIPTLDIYRIKGIPKIAFFLNLLCFTAGVIMYFVFRASDESIFFTHDAATTIALSFSGKCVF